MKRLGIISFAAFSAYMLLANHGPSGRVMTFTEDGKASIYPVLVPLDDDSYDSDLKIIYSNKTSTSEKHRRAERLLAAVQFGECRGQSIQCMYAVGHVAMNRAKLNLDVRYGKGLYGVLKHRKAFSCLNKNDPNRKVIMRALAGKLPKDSADGRKWVVAQKVAHDLMHHHSVDPTHGSTHYFERHIRPAWMKDHGMVRIAQIDGHIFYRKEG